MTEKWQRTRQWEDAHLSGAAWPVKALLRTLGSIWFGVAGASVAGIYAFAAYSGAARACDRTAVEFLTWWPARALLGLLAVNVLVVTARRVEFSGRRLGAVLLASGALLAILGSLHWTRTRVRGEAVLLSGGAPNPHSSNATDAPVSRWYFDELTPALHVNVGRGWTTVALEHLPRFGNFNLGASGGETVSKVSKWQSEYSGSESRALSIPLPEAGEPNHGVSLRVVGFAEYADWRPDWVRLDAARVGTGQAVPLRVVYVHGPEDPKAGGPVSETPAFALPLRPTLAADRTITQAEASLSVEYTLGDGGGMTAARWRDLGEALPPGAQHGLVIEVPSKDGSASYRKALGVEVGDTIVAGPTGYSIEVRQLLPTPPMPIMSEGYQGASSSVAVVRVKAPDGRGFDRYVYHRFPDIAQDVPVEETGGHSNTQRQLDTGIRISLIEADSGYVYLDEPGGTGGAGPPLVRAIVRMPGGEVRVVDRVEGGRLDLSPSVQIRIGERWEHSARSDLPLPVAPEKQEQRLVGTRWRSGLGVEVTHQSFPGFSRVVWLPFTRFQLQEGAEETRTGQRSVDLPDGTTAQLWYGRSRNAFAGFQLRLKAVELDASPGASAEPAATARVEVLPVEGSAPRGVTARESFASQSKQFSAPYGRDSKSPWVAGAIRSALSSWSPEQLTFALKSWDRAGWESSRKLVERGVLEKPHAAYVVLDVKGNPGLGVAALGVGMAAVAVLWIVVGRLVRSRHGASP